MSKNLLLEIGTEEMPANIMSGVVDQLKAVAASQFEAHRIAAENITIYATPRRLAVLVKGAADRQPDEEVKKRGPSVKAAFDADGNPTRAAQGFARGQHIDPSELVKEGEYTWAHVVHAGKKVEDVLPELFLSLITGLNFTRSMRWADEEAHFIRPVRWIVALCDKEIIPMEFAHVKSGNVSRGHRFLCKEPVVISDPLSYKETMREAFVIVDQDERREMIRTGLLAVADKLGGHVWHNADLLEEINYLVEYPTPLYGRIDDEFLKLPVPAVVTPMRDHQRYYPVRNEDGSLMPYFLTVRNGGTKALENVQHGNEKVLRARLDDAKFFFENDRKKTLEGHRDDLTRINYQEGMGDMRDKADRLQKLTEAIGKDWDFTAEEAADADRAAFLSQSALAPGLVAGFPDMRRFAGDILPQQEIGRALSLADKLDNLAATFLRGLIPTGSQDPFALRRQTIGAVNILIDGKIHWDIRRGIEAALALLPGDEETKKTVLSQIEDFFRQRIKAIMLDEGIAYDIIDAVLAGPVDDIYALFLKARSMAESQLKGEAELRQAVTRLANITKGKAGGKVDPSLFTEDVEKKLQDAFEAVSAKALPLFASYEYGKALPALKELTAPINDYLDNVMVMVDDEAVKNNRISQLLATLALFNTWGDFSKLV